MTRGFCSVRSGVGPVQFVRSGMGPVVATSTIGDLRGVAAIAHFEGAGSRGWARRGTRPPPCGRVARPSHRVFCSLGRWVHVGELYQVLRAGSSCNPCLHTPMRAHIHVRGMQHAARMSSHACVYVRIGMTQATSRGPPQWHQWAQIVVGRTVVDPQCADGGIRRGSWS